MIQPLLDLQLKWEHIPIDFIVRLPRSQKHHDAIWVIVYQHTKMMHFIVYNMTYSVEHLSRLYIQHIVRLHGVLVTIRFPRQSFGGGCR